MLPHRWLRALIALTIGWSTSALAEIPGTNGEDNNSAKGVGAAETPKQITERAGPFAASVGYYYDSRGFTTLNLTTFTGRLPHGFNIWGFMDVHASHNADGERLDLMRYFLEYRLRWQAPGRFKQAGLEVEYNDMSGQDNNLVRLGANYRQPLAFLPKSWLQIRALPVQSRGKSSQLSLIHSLRLSHSFSLVGFTDLNIPWNGDAMRWVTETQLTWHATEYLGLAIEARYNGFEEAAMDIDGFGVAFAAIASL